MKNLSKEELLSRLEAINRSNAIIYFDLDGYILGMNSIFLLAMGYEDGDHKQLIGKHHSIFVSYEYSKSDEYRDFWNTLKEDHHFDEKKIAAETCVHFNEAQQLTFFKDYFELG